MEELLPSDLPLDEQLRQLEDLYANLLMNDSDTKILTTIWGQIKLLREQLNLPIYNYVTPKELRS